MGKPEEYIETEVPSFWEVSQRLSLTGTHFDENFVNIITFSLQLTTSGDDNFPSSDQTTKENKAPTMCILLEMFSNSATRGHKHDMSYCKKLARRCIITGWINMAESKSNTLGPKTPDLSTNADSQDGSRQQAKGGGTNEKSSSFCHFLHILFSVEHGFPVKYHIHIWQMSLQLSCSNICQMWIWYKKIYFAK